MRDYVEPLEPRQLLAGDLAVTVNFQPGRAEIPAGYLADAGQTFGSRRAGFSFGWKADNMNGARDRNEASQQRYDTLNHLRPGNDWEIAVPNGFYEVRLVAGDPSYFNSIYKINVENVLAIDTVPNNEHRFFGGIVVVAVNDGRLTIASAPGGENNKLSFLAITQTDPPALPAPQPSGLSAIAVSTSRIDLQWDDVSGETGYRIERKTGTNPFQPVAIVAANDTDFSDTGLQTSTRYSYRVRSFNASGGSVSTSKSASTLSAAGTVIDWTTVAPSPIQRAEAQGVAVGDKLYVLGGFHGDAGPVLRSDVYDPASNTWARIADLPERITHAGQASDGRYIYLVGGFVGTAGGTGYAQTFGSERVYRYDTETNTYARLPDLPVARSGGGSVVVDGKLHYFSGFDISRNEVATHYVLDLNAGSSAEWATAASMPNARSHFGAVELGGKIYAVGGQHGTDAFDNLETVADVHVYNPATDQWSAVAPLPRPIGHIHTSATFVMDGRIIVAGGEVGHGDWIDDVYAYDPSTNAWTALTPLPGPRFSGVAGVINGAIYFTTGSSQTTTWRGVFVG